MDGIQIVGPSGYERVQNETSMLQALRQKGPISTTFNVRKDFLYYSDGVYETNTNCPAEFGMTALLIIGFGSENGLDYWLVQNSWGTDWGQGGYAKIKRGMDTCGIASCVTYPTAIIDPSQEPVRPFQRHLHDPVKTDAVCLDGSPAGLYYSKGFGDGANKTIIHFYGGGWCFGADARGIAKDCYIRSKSGFGSTKPDVHLPWGETQEFEFLFSGEKGKNALTYNWNRFMFIYCDGSGHQGYLKEPIRFLD